MCGYEFRAVSLQPLRPDVVRGGVEPDAVTHAHRGEERALARAQQFAQPEAVTGAHQRQQESVRVVCVVLRCVQAASVEPEDEGAAKGRIKAVQIWEQKDAFLI